MKNVNACEVKKIRSSSSQEEQKRNIRIISFYQKKRSFTSFLKKTGNGS